MKRTILLLLAALSLVACEQKKQVATNPTIAFEYCEIPPTVGITRIEYRSISTPAYIAPDLWYDFYGSNTADAIGDGKLNLPKTDKAEFVNMMVDDEMKNVMVDTVTVSYKPGVEPEYDAVHAIQKFVIYTTGDTTKYYQWRTATPIE